MPRGILALVAIGLVGAVLAAILLVRWTPQVPADAADTPIARTVMTGEVAPDPGEGTDPGQIPSSPSGGECLPRIERTDGWFDVCWEAHRSMFDGDPTKDYYLFRAYGTFGPGRTGSPRWAMLNGDLIGAPADQVMDGWPSGEFDGSCQPEPVTTMAVDEGFQETLCGHIRGFDTGTWGHAVIWTCLGCLLPDDRDRSLSLYISVGVDEGTVPEWDVYADFGS